MKYPFEEMVIEETRLIQGNPASIRTAASMLGARKGLWFVTRVVENGVMVKRVDGPARIKNKDFLIKQQISRMEDAMKIIRKCLE